MAGGTWIDQNKVRPGVYINYKSSPATLANIGTRGVVVIPKVLDWGDFGANEIESEADTMKLGYAYTSDEMLFIRQIFAGTNRSAGATKIIVYRLDTTGAAGAVGALVSGSNTITFYAKKQGSYGNKISITISADADSAYRFNVDTTVDGVTVNSQLVDGGSAAPLASLIDNDYIGVATASANASVFAGTVTLSGGADGTESALSFTNFLSYIENITFDVAIYDGTDTTNKKALAEKCKKLSNNEGKRCQCVLSDYSSADSECVISCAPQKVTLDTGEELDATALTWWVGGATAGAQINESLTYAAYPGAVAVSPIYSSSQQEAEINKGEFALIPQFGNVQCLTDINTFTTFATEKGKAFRKNRVVRVVFGLCNDIYKTFAQYYVGAVHNDDEGRKALKAEILSLMNKYQGNRALQNVNVDDVTVAKGEDSDAVLIEVNCQPVDSIEKIYINITIS